MKYLPRLSSKDQGQRPLFLLLSRFTIIPIKCKPSGCKAEVVLTKPRLLFPSFLFLFPEIFFSLILSRMTVYSPRAPNTKMMQAMTQASMAVRPSAFGELVWIVLKILIRTRKIVTSSVIRPGITSGLTRKDILRREIVHDAPSYAIFRLSPALVCQRVFMQSRGVLWQKQQ